MAFHVTFWGVRGSIPTPGPLTSVYGGNTACVEIRIDDALFICDAGTGLRELGIDLLSRGLGVVDAHFFFSHMHWDHIQGFPFFAPAYIPQHRMRIYGPRAGDSRYHDLLSGQMESAYFPVDFADLGGHIEPADLGDGHRVIEGVDVTCVQQNHPGTSWAYAFAKNGCRVVYATDSEIDGQLPDPAAVRANPAAPRAVPASLVEFCRGADLLIADAQYTDDDYPTKVGWGHARASTVVDLAVQAGVKQLALYHHDPMRTDPQVDVIVDDCRKRAQSQGSEVFIFAAREGIELRLDR